MLSFSEEHTPKNTVHINTAVDGDFHFLSPRRADGMRIFQISGLRIRSSIGGTNSPATHMTLAHMRHFQDRLDSLLAKTDWHHLSASDFDPDGWHTVMNDDCDGGESSTDMFISRERKDASSHIIDVGFSLSHTLSNDIWRQERFDIRPDDQVDASNVGVWYFSIDVTDRVSDQGELFDMFPVQMQTPEIKPYAQMLLQAIQLDSDVMNRKKYDCYTQNREKRDQFEADVLDRLFEKEY